MRAAIEQTLTVENVTPFQTAWQGICADYMPFAFFSDLAMTAAQREQEFTRAYRSGIKIARALYDPGWAYSTYPAGSPDWTNARMTAVYNWIRAMQDRDIRVVLNTGWSFPGQICEPFTGVAIATTPTVPLENLWASWFSESLHQMINVRGLTNVVGAVLFTESNQSAEPIPGGYTRLEYYIHVAQVLDAKIRADDASRTPIRSRIVISGSQEQSTTDVDTWTENVGANGSTYIDVAAAHSYNLSPTFAPLALAASNFPDYATLIARYTAWKADGGARPFWVDEGWTVIGGDTDSTGYRATADAGLQMCRWFQCAMEAGCAASFMWTLHNEKYWPTPASSVTQQYGLCDHAKDGTGVRPSWYAASMFANLTGGGGVTSLYRVTNVNAALHATGVHIPPGQRHVRHPLGEESIIVINEGAAPVRALINLARPLGAARTFYRYVYGAEIPPTAAADPAYLIPWDQTYAEVGSALPPNVIPGRSLVIYSTIPLSAPTAVSLSPAAVATSDSTGFGSADNVNDGNRSNVIGAGNGWRKADNASHYVELTWPAAVSMTRLELAFVATTPGVVYATYADTSTPAPAADYTAQWWNGAAFVDFPTPVNVTGNASPNRTHAFGRVTTTKVRITVTSAAATGAVNHVGVFNDP